MKQMMGQGSTQGGMMTADKLTAKQGPGATARRPSLRKKKKRLGGTKGGANGCG